MFLKSQLTWNVTIPAENLDTEGMMLQKAILLHLMNEFATKKASKDLGYFIAITTLDCVGEGKVRLHTGDLFFPVSFTCITFKMLLGEVLQGTVHKILKHGVFLVCGPAEKVYLSHYKMSGYQYVPGEKPVFRNEKSGTIIEKGVVLRFVVLAEKYNEAENDFRAVVSMEGDHLGPV
ncbi:hypothetical protein RD792_009994 [Penstemon davidsonii]|uniref:DNA-directed RNA polymerase subunit n=1 Tax=Penstemon davidsonii TaxID=160366 RepID=A0ABR0D0L5_9LAMI|nr:hypothetical protein RD792_009994 [Penstemon davidsonii]